MLKYYMVEYRTRKHGWKINSNSYDRAEIAVEVAQSYEFTRPDMYCVVVHAGVEVIYDDELNCRKPVYHTFETVYNGR